MIGKFSLIAMIFVELKGGGIICYVKNGIVYKDISSFNVDDIKALWIEVNLPQTKPILLGTVIKTSWWKCWASK